MSTITAEQQAAIAAKLAGMTLPEGIGTAENACSIAAINLALTGTLTDDIPPCMSEVIGKWIISVQDAMPSEMRNSSEWKELLPLAAGTGRDREKERLEIIMQWMWTDVLPTVQPVADRDGFGIEWRAMTDAKTQAAAEAAAGAARVADAAEAAEAVWAAADAAGVGARVGDAARAAAKAAEAAGAALAAKPAAKATARSDALAALAAAARSAARAGDAADAAARGTWAALTAAESASWAQFNPCGLLRRLIEA